MNLQERFNQYWKENFHQLSTTNCQLLVAVSGGVDSIVLIDLIAKSGFHFSIAHCNFQLRGKESERDETFIKGLAQKYTIPVHVKKIDTVAYAEENKLGIQEAARELRYKWFKELISQKLKVKSHNRVKSYPLSTIHYPLITAHHADEKYHHQ